MTLTIHGHTDALERTEVVDAFFAVVSDCSVRNRRSALGYSIYIQFISSLANGRARFGLSDEQQIGFLFLQATRNARTAVCQRFKNLPIICICSNALQLAHF